MRKLNPREGHRKSVPEKPGQKPEALGTSDPPATEAGNFAERQLGLSAETEEFLNEHQVGSRLQVAVPTLRRWRLLRKGPKYLKVGSLVRYRAADVRAWLDGCPTGGGE